MDYILVVAILRLHELRPPSPRPTKRLRTSKPSTSPPRPQLQQLQLFPDLEIQITIPDEHTNPVYVTGRAARVLGYGDRTSPTDGTVLVAIVAKRRDQFGAAEGQLLTYLAVLRQLRINAEWNNCVVQGFYTDGERYVFMCIGNNGLIGMSNVYDIRGQEQRMVVFNFIVSVLEWAARTRLVKGDRGADMEDVGGIRYQETCELGGVEILNESEDEEGILLVIRDAGL